MLVTDGNTQYHVKGVFEYDPANLNYENGDIVYLPGDPQLYIYMNDSNTNNPQSPYTYLKPLWYKDVITEVNSYLIAEIMQEINYTPNNDITNYLKRPVSLETLTSILRAKFGTGILTKDGNSPLDLNDICQTGRYVILLGHISDVNNLPSVFTFNYTTNYPNEIIHTIGLDVWAGRVYQNCASGKCLTSIAFRQTLFVSINQKMIVATRSGSANINSTTPISISYDNVNDTLTITPNDLLSNSICCGELNINWNNWTTLSEYPVNVLFNYYANRIDTLITSFNHSVNRMVLGIRPVYYRVTSLPSNIGNPPDNDTTTINYQVEIDISNIPMTLHSLSQISAVSLNCTMRDSNTSPVYMTNFFIPIPNMQPDLSLSLSTAKIVYFGQRKFYVTYTLLNSSNNYGAVLHIISPIFNKLFTSTSNISDSIVDIVLLT